jgi:serine/threonine protein kinase
LAVDLSLPRGYGLNEYRIESTLGVGGFGVTYLATDSNLNLKVAIKEYLPGDVATRNPDNSVRSKSPEGQETFEWGRSRFLEESRTLASFRHPNIVRVMRFFEANGTAYMVMEFVAGHPLNGWIKNKRPIAEEAVLALVKPLLEGLEVVHNSGYLHRDIKPDNIFIRADGSPVLLDFGSARMPQANQDMTTIVSLGFAPFEQYHSRGGEGPWTDIYALGGVLYWVLTGERPVEAPGRAFEDPMKPATKAADASRYSRQLLSAIDWALSPTKEKRPQSVAELRNVLPTLPGERAADKHDTVRDPHTVAPTERVSHPPATTLFDDEALARMTGELARHIGPIAGKLVHGAAKRAGSLGELVRKIAAEIADEHARTAFIRKHAPEAFSSSGPRTPSRPNPSAPGGALSEAALAKAEADLAACVGAVAKVLVRRLAPKARTEAELYLLLSDHIEDAAERKAFVRKALSISGRRT